MCNFKKGKIVRRLISGSVQIGDYWRIESMHRGSMTIRSLVSPSIVLTTADKNLYACVPMPSLVVSKTAIELIRSNRQYRVIHLINKVWEKVLKNQPSIVRFHSVTDNSEVIVKVENIYRTKTLTETCVNINIEYIISYSKDETTV